MDRRLIAWFITSSILFAIYLGLWQWFGPKLQPEKPADAVAQVEPEKQAAAGELKPDTKESKSDPAKTDAPAELKPGPEAVVPSVAPQWLTLGSMDPKENTRLLVTLNNQGASIERIEAVEQTSPGKFRFRALDTRRAYIGYLAETVVDQGLKVNVVGPGTPIATAKRKSEGQFAPVVVGDILQSIDGIKLSSIGDLERYFEKTKPGAEVDLEVLRVNGTKETLLVTLIPAPMEVVRLTDTSTEEIVGNLSRLNCLTTLGQVDTKSVLVGQRSIAGLEATLNGNWEAKSVTKDGWQGAEFTLPLGKALEAQGVKANLSLVKRYWLRPASPDKNLVAGQDGYFIDLEIEIVNHDDQPHQVSVRQEGLNGLTLESWWYSPKISPYWFSRAGARDVVYKDDRSGSHQLKTCMSIYTTAKQTPDDPGLIFGATEAAAERSLQYLGLDGFYFTTAFVRHPDSPSSMVELKQAGTAAIADAASIPRHQEIATNVSFWLETAQRQIEPGKSLTEKFRIFAGPKDPTLLNLYGLGSCIEFGYFGGPAWVLGGLLHFFYSIVQNYGVAIVLLTFLVRGCLFPLGRQAALNAQRMQELAPELKKINELYKDDMNKRAQATQEFYAKNNFRPWAGCLPVFFQIPIFIGLYRCLSVDIELRQQPLIPGIDWCSNLAGPDQLIHWATWMPEIIAGRGTGWFGPYFNILPCVTITLFIIQQKIMMPKATDEQMEMTQKMMLFMTIFMGLLFFKVPAGLCLYFVTSSIWSLIERRLVKRLGPPPKREIVQVAALGGDRSAKAVPATKKSLPKWLEKVRDLADQAAQDNSSTYRKDGQKPQKRNRKQK